MELNRQQDERDLGRLVGMEEDSHTDHVGVYTQSGPDAETEGQRLRRTGGRQWKLYPQIQFARRAQRMRDVQGRVLGTLTTVRCVMAAKSLQQGL